MAIMEGTTSPASRSPSPASSDASHGRSAMQKSTESYRAHPDSVNNTQNSPDVHRRSDLPQSALTCEWDDCGERFANVHGLVGHLENGHIGVHKSSYTCEWASCPRRGLVQTSRFALVSHCRSHTGEKPFVCSVPECDKSFTRSDTLAKHLRHQHNITTPAPTRGGYRKRKRSMTPPNAHAAPSAPAPERHASNSPMQLHPETITTATSAGPAAHAPSHYNFANRAYAQYHDPRDSGFNTFRVNPTIHDRPAPSTSSTIKLPHSEPPVERLPREGYAPPPATQQREEEVASSSSGDEDSGNPYNAETKGGRSKAMVKYMIMKAKYRYVMDQKELLNDELETLKRQEQEEWREKEAGVDRILRAFGPQSEQLIHEPDVSMNGNKRGRAPLSPQEDARTDGPLPPHLTGHEHRMEVVDAR